MQLSLKRRVNFLPFFAALIPVPVPVAVVAAVVVGELLGSSTLRHLL